MTIFFYSLLMMFSVSVRTPNIQPNPLDYEIAMGVEIGDTSKVELWAWRERESGALYIGIDGKFKLRKKRIENEIIYLNREANNILRYGSTTNLIFYKYGRVGIASIWDHGDMAGCFNLGIASKYINGNVKLYGKNDYIESAYLKIGIDFETSSWITLSPLFKYTMDRNKNEFMQGKLVFKIKRKK